ncbi:hypothetical protein QJQ45_007209 [Haematococcus lacustris]|nr:hypothetical protein QJQ45_007209 [Haematococcus lacustris]
MLALTYPDAVFATPLTYSPPFLPPSLPSSLQCRSRRFHTLVTAAKRTDAENEARFAATKLLYTEEDYNGQQQSVQRAQWATAVRQSKSASKGAQYIMHRATNWDSLALATADCDLRIAFTRWSQHLATPFYDLQGMVQHPVVQQLIRQAIPASSLSSPASQPRTQASAAPEPASTRTTSGLITQGSVAAAAGVGVGGSTGVGGVGEGEGAAWAAETGEPAAPNPNGQAGSASSSQAGAASSSQAGSGSSSQAVVRVALVFGREELGLSDDEVKACDVACSIPIGRLQESLSLSHAVSITLATLFQSRLACLTSPPPAGWEVENVARAEGRGEHPAHPTTATNPPPANLGVQGGAASPAYSSSVPAVVPKAHAPYVVKCRADMVEGYDTTAGQER